MPLYTYESLTTGEIFEFRQKVSDQRYTHHPKNGEPLQRILVPGMAIAYQGLRKHVVVNKKSPAATACGCASGVALAQQMYANSRTTPGYGSMSSLRTVTGGISKPKHITAKECSHGHTNCEHKHS